jgi:hypothetical protein
MLEVVVACDVSRGRISDGDRLDITMVGRIGRGQEVVLGAIIIGIRGRPTIFVPEVKPVDTTGCGVVDIVTTDGWKDRGYAETGDITLICGGR